MARLFDRFDPDRERWSSYLMRAEFYFDSNNITTDLVDSVPSTARPRGSMDLLSWTSRRGHGSRTVPWTCDGTREKKNTTYQKKKAALCSTMSPETFALLQNLLTREVTDVTYEEVKAALRQHYEEKRNFLAARLDFFRTVQQEGQSITDFLAELRNKAKECDFEEQCCVKCQDNALRDRLVMGCRHTFIQQAILKEGDASLTNVLVCQHGRTTQQRAVQNARTNDRPHNRPYSTGSTRCSSQSAVSPEATLLR